MSDLKTTLEELSRKNRIEELLSTTSASSGLSETDARAASERFAAAAKRLSKRCRAPAEAVAARIPGRIEFLGKHTDYAGGQSMTCAVRRSFCMVASAYDGPGIHLEEQTTGASVFVPWDASAPSTGPPWRRYAEAAARRLATNFGLPSSGVSIVFSSDIPRASGMSSSSAFIVGIWLSAAAIVRAFESEPFARNLRLPEDVAAYLASVENGANFGELTGDAGVGTRGGAQDHASIFLSRAGELGLYGYRPLRRMGTVALPAGLTFVVASSGVKASKAAGALQDYNNAVYLAERATDLWRISTEEPVETLEDVASSSGFSLGMFEKMAAQRVADERLQEALRLRVRQYVSETREIVPAAIEALETGDRRRIGELVSRSQQLADDCLGNQVPETRFLAQSALEAGAVAASSFGAGFGGSVYALVETESAQMVLSRWMSAYGRAFGHRLRRACFFTDPTGPAAILLGIDPSKLLLDHSF